MNNFNFDNIQYPAFIVVYGPSKNWITTYNRSEYSELFASDTCYNAESAKRLIAGYQGRNSDLQVIAASLPQKVCQLSADGQSTTDYEADQCQT